MTIVTKGQENRYQGGKASDSQSNKAVTNFTLLFMNTTVRIIVELIQ